jgi:hypothetical protein
MSLRNTRPQSKNKLKEEIKKEIKKETEKELEKKPSISKIKNENVFIIRLSGKDGQFKYEGEKTDKVQKLKEFISKNIEIEEKLIYLSFEPEKNYLEEEKTIEELKIK